MSENPLKQLYEEGVSVWLDFLSRDLVRGGALTRFIEEDGVRGQTSNPTIFQQAITGGDAYRDQILELASQDRSPAEICWELMIADVQEACDIFTPIYEESGGEDGYVSLELDPTLAHDAEASIRQARELRERVSRPNVMFKVPGTVEGLPVIETLVSEGFNVNVTLLFAVSRYEEVIDAYMTGLERRLEAGESISEQASVASFFVSRVDTEVDRRLDAILRRDPSTADVIAGLRGQVAVANAQVAYEKFQQRFESPRWQRLAERGGKLQRPLWASTSTKNPRYSDILYVRELIGPHCVNTMPETTLRAFRDHGVVKRTLTPENIAVAHSILRRVADLGVDMEDVTLRALVAEGVEKFARSYRELVEAVASAREELLSRA